jgi:hypothetical protein
MPESYRFSLKYAAKIKKTVEIPSNKRQISYVAEIQFGYKKGRDKLVSCPVRIRFTLGVSL